MTYRFCQPRCHIEVQRLVDTFVSEAATLLNSVNWMFGAVPVWGCQPTCEPDFLSLEKYH